MTTNTASNFTRISLEIQQGLTASLKTLTSVVYVYDSTKYFEDADNCIHNGVRYKQKNGKFAVLSVAAQRAFIDSNQYKQFSTAVLQTDEIGLFLSL